MSSLFFILTAATAGTSAPSKRGFPFLSRTVISSFIIMLRETVEMVLILGAVHAALRSSEHRGWILPFWFGIAGGIVLSFLLGMFMGEVSRLPGGNAAGWLSVMMSIAAAAFLYSMTVWAWVHQKKSAEHFTRRMHEHASGGNTFAIFAAILFVVGREGAEAVVALFAARPVQDSIRFIVGGVMGMFAAFLVGWLLSLGFRRIPLRPFFILTSIVLFILATHLAVEGVEQLVGYF